MRKFLTEPFEGLQFRDFPFRVFLKIICLTIAMQTLYLIQNTTVLFILLSLAYVARTYKNIDYFLHGHLLYMSKFMGIIWIPLVYCGTGLLLYAGVSQITITIPLIRMEYFIFLVIAEGILIALARKTNSFICIFGVMCCMYAHNGSYTWLFNFTRANSTSMYIRGMIEIFLAQIGEICTIAYINLNEQTLKRQRK